MKRYIYNKSYNKHLDTKHPKEMKAIREEPFDLVQHINREHYFNELNKEAEIYLENKGGILHG